MQSALAELSSGRDSDPERTEVHWLLQHPYGRDLLACQLRKSRPAVEFEHYCLGPEIHPQLEEMVDQLGLREWRRPATLAGRAQAAWLLLRMIWALKMERRLPRWQKIEATAAGCSRDTDAHDA